MTKCPKCKRMSMDYVRSAYVQGDYLIHFNIKECLKKRCGHKIYKENKIKISDIPKIPSK